MIIPIQLGAQSYDIALARGALNNIQQYLALNRRALIVTDDGVPAKYAQTVADQCKQALVVTLPHGEASKCFDNYRLLLDRMMEHDFTRQDCVIAVGGGVIGDLSGFAAATYMRGIDFYNIPTTFLSQVDSSIGGKVAIDVGGIKNIVGAFYQPKGVIIDPDVLKTLDPRQLSAGMAESIKMAATCNAELFSMIENTQNIDEITDSLIEGSLRIKKNVVEQDPTEKGLRRVLNFGHTIGHAIESSKKGALLHGECVSLGMLPLCDEDVRDRLIRVLTKFHLPTRTDIRVDDLMSYMKHDKKADADGINLVYVPEIGQFTFRKVGMEELRGYLERWCATNR